MKSLWNKIIYSEERNKQNEKKLLKVLIGIIIILVVIIGVFSFIKTRKIVRPNTNYVAIIYHSEMMGIDTGYEYIYYIYPDENDTYLYIKSKAEITIVGSSNEKDINSGKIKNEVDFEKIKKDIEKDKIKDTQQFFSYTYINNGNVEKFTSIEELAKKLF